MLRTEIDADVREGKGSSSRLLAFDARPRLVRGGWSAAGPVTLRPKPALAVGALVLAMLLLIPTGTRPPWVFWNLAVMVAGVYTLARLGGGRWAAGRPDSLGILLLGGSVAACWQLAFLDLDAPFHSWSGLLFWAGSGLLLLVVRDALSGLHANPRLAARWKFVLLATLLFLFGASLLSGRFGTDSPALAALLSWATGKATTPSQPVWWPFLYRNHLAALVVLVLPWLLWEAFSVLRMRSEDLSRLSRGGLWRAGLSCLAAMLGMATVLASGSRSGLLLVGAELLLMALLAFRLVSAEQSSGSSKPRPISRWGLAGFLLVIVMAAIAVGGEATLQYRLRAHGSPLEGRVDFWRASAEMIRERPLGGWGFGAWPDVYRQFQVRDNGLVVNRAHSDWLEWAAEGGVLMAALLVAVLIGATRAAWRAPWSLGLPMLLVYGMGDYVLRQPLVWLGFLLLWVAAARTGATAPASRATDTKTREVEGRLLAISRRGAREPAR
jgi:O-antigen ligase